VCPRVGLGIVQKRKLLQGRESKPGRPASNPSLYRLRYVYNILIYQLSIDRFSKRKEQHAAKFQFTFQAPDSADTGASVDRHVAGFHLSRRTPNIQRAREIDSKSIYIFITWKVLEQVLQLDIDNNTTCLRSTTCVTLATGVRALHAGCTLQGPLREERVSDQDFRLHPSHGAA
jgi:hypothetical protein